MSIFFQPRRTVESRAITSWDFVTGGGLDSPRSMEKTLSIVPVFAATSRIAGDISTLPLQGYRKTGEARQPMPLPSVFPKPTGRLISPNLGLVAWLMQPLMSLLIRGNAYGLVVSWTAGGQPGKVVWLNPENMTVDESGSLPVYRYNGAEVDRMNLIHIPAYVMPGSVVGLSPIGACAALGSTALNTQDMTSDWFKSPLPGSTMQNTQRTIDREDAATISDGLNARIKAGKPLVYGNDWKFEPVTMSASDAAFIESTKMNATQVAAIYHIPPEMIGGDSGSSLTYSTVELNTIRYATEALTPWIARLEETFSSWLPSPQFVKFNLDAMIRVDTKTRYEVHQISRQIGLNNIDELRALEDRAPLPDGQGEDFTPLAAKTPTPAAKETR